MNEFKSAENAPEENYQTFNCPFYHEHATGTLLQRPRRTRMVQNRTSRWPKPMHSKCKYLSTNVEAPAPSLQHRRFTERQRRTCKVTMKYTQNYNSPRPSHRPVHYPALPKAREEEDENDEWQRDERKRSNLQSQGTLRNEWQHSRQRQSARQDHPTARDRTPVNIYPPSQALESTQFRPSMQSGGRWSTETQRDSYLNPQSARASEQCPRASSNAQETKPQGRPPPPKSEYYYNPDPPRTHKVNRYNSQQTSIGDTSPNNCAFVSLAYILKTDSASIAKLLHLPEGPITLLKASQSFEKYVPSLRLRLIRAEDTAPGEKFHIDPRDKFTLHCPPSIYKQLPETFGVSFAYSGLGELKAHAVVGKKNLRSKDEIYMLDFQRNEKGMPVIVEGIVISIFFFVEKRK